MYLLKRYLSLTPQIRNECRQTWNSKSNVFPGAVLFIMFFLNAFGFSFWMKIEEPDAGILFQNSLPFFRKEKDSSLFSSFLKKCFFQHSIKSVHVDKHSCNLTFPVEPLYLPCANKPHQTLKENQILYQFFRWPPISRNWDVMKLFLPLLIHLYLCTVIFL